MLADFSRLLMDFSAYNRLGKNYNAWRILICGIASLCLLKTSSASADGLQLTEPKLVTPVKLEEPWEFKLGVPGWFAGVSGEVGVNSRNAQVNVQPDVVIRHLDSIATVSAEARKGRFGIYTDFLYLGDSATQSPGGLISTVDLKVNEYLADFELSWRVVEKSSGWVDLRGGVRYTNLFNQIGFTESSSAVNRATADLVNAANEAVRRILDRDLHGALDQQHPVLPEPPLAGNREDALVRIIQKLKQNPALVDALRSGDPARIAAATHDVRENIARALRSTLNRTYATSQDWFDPYVGFGARLNLCKAFYLTGKADIGGFGLGSNLTCEAYGALGCQLTRRVWTEAGYKLLWVDYRSKTFVYNTTTSGFEITGGINF